MQKEYFNMKEEASPSPSEGGDVFPQTLLSIEKKPLHQPQLQPHPPTPLRMERGVKTASRMGEDDKWE